MGGCGWVGLEYISKVKRKCSVLPPNCWPLARVARTLCLNPALPPARCSRPVSIVSTLGPLWLCCKMPVVAAGLVAGSSSAHKRRGSAFSQNFGKQASRVGAVDDLPALDERLGEGRVDKKVLQKDGSSRWEPRHAMYTKSLFYLTRALEDEESLLGESTVLDCIPLDEIESVVKVELERSLMRSDSSAQESPLAPRRSENQRGGSLRGSLASRVSEHLGSVRGSRSGGKSDQQDGNGDAVREESTAAFNIVTVAGGYNGGRIYCLRVASHGDAEHWVQMLSEQAEKARRELELMALGTSLARAQAHARNMYKSIFAQSLVATVIVASFFVGLWDSELQPEQGTLLGGAFMLCELMFTAFFSLELIFNLFGSCVFPLWRPPGFLSNAWNLFDTAVVGVSLWSVIDDSMPAGNVIRFMRIVRVIKIFRWTRSGTLSHTHMHVHTHVHTHSHTHTHTHTHTQVPSAYCQRVKRLDSASVQQPGHFLPCDEHIFGVGDKHVWRPIRRVFRKV